GDAIAASQLMRVAVMRPSGFRRLLEWWCHRIAAGPERQNELTRCIQQKLAKAAKKTFVDLINRDYLCLRRAELGHTAAQLKRIPLPPNLEEDTRVFFRTMSARSRTPTCWKRDNRHACGLYLLAPLSYNLVLTAKMPCCHIKGVESTWSPNGQIE